MELVCGACVELVWSLCVELVWSLCVELVCGACVWSLCGACIFQTGKFALYEIAILHKTQIFFHKKNGLDDPI